MNLIYTYKKTKIGHHKGFTDRGIDVMRLSVESANKFYKTFVYCDKESAKLFRLNKIPFNKIIIVDWLDEFEFPNWGLAKLETMLHQTEPYIHIDFDTIITKKLKPRTEDISWGYGEIDIFKNIRLTYDTIEHLNLYYKTAKEYEDYKKFDYSKIANASVIVVNSPFRIKKIIEELKYKIISYKDIVSSEMNMFIEQFMFYQLVSTKNHLTHSFISNTNYNDLNLFWMNEIQNDKTILNNFIDNAFIHWPELDKFTNTDFKFIYEILLNKLDIIDFRSIKKIVNTII